MTIDLNDHDYFPRPEDNLFELKAKNSSTSSHCSMREQFYHMIIGYKDAADFLVAHVTEARQDVRKFGNPIMFLYRHHLELALKCLIFDCHSFLGNKEDFPKIHRIEELWTDCRGLLHKISPELSNNEEIQQTTRLLSDLQKIDPESQSFRYPDNNYKKMLSHDHSVIDLSDVRDIIGKISLLLECISAHVSSMEENNF